MESLTQTYFLDNNLSIWFKALLFLFLGILIARIVAKLISKLCYPFFHKYTPNSEWDTFHQLLFGPLWSLCVVCIVFFSYQIINVPSSWQKVWWNAFSIHQILSKFWLICFILSITWIVMRTIDFIAHLLIVKARNTETKTDDQVLIYAKDFIKVIVVLSSLLLILGMVLHIDIRSLLGAAGIATLAVALAAKETLENLISSMIIFTEQPYGLGDTVKIGDAEGVVEKIGFRSTLLRTSDKTLVTIPNKKMIDNNTENLTLRSYRRVKQDIHIETKISSEKIKSIINEMKQALDTFNNDKAEMGNHSIYLKDLSNGALHIVVEYLIANVKTTEINKIRETYNITFLEIFEKHNAALVKPN